MEIMKRGFTCGAFDLLHPGHLYLLKYAKQHCDYLIVGLHTNPQHERSTKHRPVQTMFERWSQLTAVKYVNEIIPYDTEEDLYNMLTTINIQTRFLGSDYAGKPEFTGMNLCELLKINIVYVPRYHSFSSSNIRARLEKFICGTSTPSSSTVME